MFGGIEAGGTKFVCAVGTDPDDIRAQVSFPTTTPEETIGRAIDFLAAQQQQTPLTAIGIGGFGPLDPKPSSPHYGYITTTPKPGWQQTDLVGPIKESLGIPVGFDTDVNCAARGEYRWGAAQGLDSFIYLTVGTGIGGGCLINGQPVHGLMHPEMGHIRIPHDLERDPFPGNCPYHGDCLEGLANGPALAARWGQKGVLLPPAHPAWQLEAEYLALALVNYILTIMPERIVLGGGVMQQAQLFPLIRARVLELLNGYLAVPEIVAGIDEYIVPPGLGNRAGVLGAIALAESSSGRSPDRARLA
ncbi:MAG: ROK family protein [Chloroflexota bacterium]|nr:ROK family protein [Chloroflexota bacterium]